MASSKYDFTLTDESIAISNQNQAIFFNETKKNLVKKNEFYMNLKNLINAFESWSPDYSKEVIAISNLLKDPSIKDEFKEEYKQILLNHYRSTSSQISLYSKWNSLNPSKKVFYELITGKKYNEDLYKKLTDILYIYTTSDMTREKLDILLDDVFSESSDKKTVKEDDYINVYFFLTSYLSTNSEDPNLWYVNLVFDHINFFEKNYVYMINSNRADESKRLSYFTEFYTVLNRILFLLHKNIEEKYFDISDWKYILKDEFKDREESDWNNIPEELILSLSKLTSRWYDKATERWDEYRKLLNNKWSSSNSTLDSLETLKSSFNKLNSLMEVLSDYEEYSVKAFRNNNNSNIEELDNLPNSNTWTTNNSVINSWTSINSNSSNNTTWSISNTWSRIRNNTTTNSVSWSISNTWSTDNQYNEQ